MFELWVIGGPGISGLMIAGREGHKRKQRDKSSFLRSFMRALFNSTWNREAGHWVWGRAEGTFPYWSFVGGF